jgi:transposase
MEAVPPECAELLIAADLVIYEPAEQIAALKAELIAQKRGHQSERLEEKGTAGDDGKQREKPASGRGQRPGQPGHGRRHYEHLPVEEVVLQPDADLLHCESCGLPFEPFGEDSSEQIDWQVVVRRVRHRRPRYRRACRCPGRAIVRTLCADARFEATG